MDLTYGKKVVHAYLVQMDAVGMGTVDAMVNVHVKLGSLAPIVPVLKRPALMVA